ncbi:MAG: SIMPL domain-containing protein, partial [Verrucomicrobiota bacterium]
GKTLEEARAKFEGDQRRLIAFLSAKGFARHTLSPVHVRDIAPRGKGAPDADEGQLPQRVGYQLLQGVQISSERVEDLPNLAAECLTLLADGVVVQTSGIQYIYTKLPEARLTMLGEATDVARRRAEEIAGRGGRAVR